MNVEIIVTLTTLPRRLAYIQPVIDSILKQEYPPTKVQLYIPIKYRREDVGEVDESHLPHGCEIIRCSEDFGPATKILPAVIKHRGSKVALVYCDDDRIYDKNWLKRLVEASDQYPESVIAEEAMNSKARLNTIYWRQRKILYKFLRIFTFGIWKHNRFIKDEKPNIAEGYGGVLVKPHFFNEEVFDIPDILWTVDDIWLSGMLAVSNHKIKKTIRQSFEGSKPSDNDVYTQSSSLKILIYKGYDRLASDKKCIEYMIKNFGVLK